MASFFLKDGKPYAIVGDSVRKCTLSKDFYRLGNKCNVKPVGAIRDHIGIIAAYQISEEITSEEPKED